MVDILQNLIIPGSGDNNFRPMVLIEPLKDPANSFRAQTVGEMYFIVPERTEFSTFEFDVGLDPKIKPVVFSIQNRCLNMTLRATLTLPSYLRSNLGSEFLIPSIGDTTTEPVNTSTEQTGQFDVPPIVIPPRVNAGKGLINVTFTFSEEQAKLLNPDEYLDEIIFDIFPNGPITGPIFVSTLVGAPRNLNIEDEIFPVDDDQPIETGSCEPAITFITESVEIEVEVPTLSPGFVAGADGITGAGISFIAGELVEGPPPAGWTTEADGRAYPPLILDKDCDSTGQPGAGVPDDQLTPLQLLVRQSEDIPPTFGTLTVRRGFQLEPEVFLDGVDTDRVTRLTPALMVADSVPGRTEFKIINTSDTMRNGNVISPLDPLFNLYIRDTNFHTSLTKEGQVAPFDLKELTAFILSSTLDKIVNEGATLTVPAEFESFNELQSFRILSTAASLIFSLNNDGAGFPVN